jgi:hypothetical protein
MLVLLVLLSRPAMAADKPNPAKKTDKPDMALLEYLGEFETAKGKWIDPMDIQPEDTQAKSGGNEDHHEK